ncbi:MAG: TSUP family transporter [Pseudomonadota bacterium]
MYFPTADIETALYFPPLVSFVVSFFTSMGGISGAFLLLPFQVSILGYTAPSVSATNQLYNIVAIPSGVFRFIQEDRMLWPLSVVVIIGTLPGVLLGTIIRLQYLPNHSDFKVFAGLVLLYMGLRMVRECLRGPMQSTCPSRGTQSCGPQSTKEQSPKAQFFDAQRGGPNCPYAQGNAVTNVQWSMRRVTYCFRGQTFHFSSLSVFMLCLAVGLVGGVYGIGGGAIIAPFLVSVFGLPVYTVAGASLLGTFATSIAGVLFYMALAPWYPHLSVSPDWLLGLLLGLGGMLGMYCGARCQRFVPARYIRFGLTCILLSTAFSYLFS